MKIKKYTACFFLSLVQWSCSLKDKPCNSDVEKAFNVGKVAFNLPDCYSIKEIEGKQGGTYSYLTSNGQSVLEIGTDEAGRLQDYLEVSEDEFEHFSIDTIQEVLIVSSIRGQDDCYEFEVLFIELKPCGYNPNDLFGEELIPSENVYHTYLATFQSHNTLNGTCLSLEEMRFLIERLRSSELKLK